MTPTENYQWDILLFKANIGTASVVMRSDLYKEIHDMYKEDFRGYRMGDTQTWFHFARLSKIKYLPVVTMTYRKHEGSATALKDYEKSSLFQKDMLRMRALLCSKYNAPDMVIKEINARMTTNMIVNHLNGGGIIMPWK